MHVNLRMLTNHLSNKIKPKSILRVRFNLKQRTGQIEANLCKYVSGHFEQNLLDIIQKLFNPTKVDKLRISKR